MGRNDNILRRILETLHQIACNELEILSFIRHERCRHHITHFHIKEIFMFPIAPGFNPVYTATPVPEGSVPSTPPTWTSSDTTNAPVTVDASGLVATVAIPSTAVVGTAFTLTVSYTNADGIVATGSLSQTIVAAPPADITSFTIAQTA